MGRTSATVETLTAEVRALMVGSRQVTLSVFRQLDIVDYVKCEPMGRVNDGSERWIVGRHKETGELTRAEFSSLWESLPRFTSDDQHRLNTLTQLAASSVRNGRELGALDTSELASLTEFKENIGRYQQEYRDDLSAFKALPLIILAGLK